MWEILIAAVLAGAPQSRDDSGQGLIRCAPRTYQAALDCLDQNLGTDMKNGLATKEGVIQAHFGLGMFIRNNWGLWKGGPLAGSMRKLGFTHPDDMSATILEGYSARLSHKPYDLRAKAAYYRAWWSAAAKSDEAFKQACKTRKPVPLSDTTVAVCEWSDRDKTNIMHTENSKNIRFFESRKN